MDMLFDLFMILFFMTGLITLLAIGEGIMRLLDKLCPKTMDKLLQLFLR